MYIGSKKIKEIVQDEKGTHLTFKDEPSISLSTKLYDLIVSETKGEGNATDAVNHYFSAKFVSELAEYDLDYYMVEGIGIAMRTLTHNLRENLMRNVFDCSGGDAMNLKYLVDEDYAKEEVEKNTAK